MYLSVGKRTGVTCDQQSHTASTIAAMTLDIAINHTQVAPLQNDSRWHQQSHTGSSIAAMTLDGANNHTHIAPSQQ